MAFGINSRRIKKALRRLKSLPGGLNFFKYTANKVHAWYLKKTKSTRVAHPSSIMLEVTNHCNLKCITCPREYQYGEEWKRALWILNNSKKLLMRYIRMLIQ
jgi:hypothetical protein